VLVGNVDAFGLNCRSGTEQSGQMQHRDAEALADEVARLVDRDVVSGRAVTIHHEDPFETVLRDLRPDVRDQRTQRGLADAICAGVDQVVGDFVGAALA
jgi:hypothetical protein